MRTLIALMGMVSMYVITSASGQSSRSGEPHGELLYSTYCVGCHTTQVHWRDKTLATDWTGLKTQVRRWQQNVGLGWEEGDVSAVAQYLNDLYYHFPATDTKQSGEAGAPHQLAALR